MTTFLDIANTFNIDPKALILLIIWSLTWKGIALWKAGRKKHLVWFIVILIINTIGILEILYIFLFSGLKFEKKQAVKFREKKRKK